jgi:ATP-dependent helicase YprA (DUF1998 family)
MLRHRHLGHEFLTDVVEIRIGGLAVEARSVLYALLEGATSLSIARDEIDGTLHTASTDGSLGLIIYDRVPGGAGHAQRIAESLPNVFESALERVGDCECGEETSCYSCLRSYSNQVFHDDLSRGAAARVLEQVLGVKY